MICEHLLPSQRNINQDMMRLTFLMPALLLLVLPPPAHACTAFCVAARGRVLVGNNEDLFDPHTRLWFISAENGEHGRMYVGYDYAWPQGGMNDRGLFFDGFSVPLVKLPPSTRPPLQPVANRVPNRPFPGGALDRFLAECASIEDVIGLFRKYEFPWAEKSVLMFVDASGEAAIFDGNGILRKKGRFLVQTNFRQSATRPGEVPCERFRIATGMLESAGDNTNIDLFRRILAATHQEGDNPTQYSNIYDLKRRIMYLYHFHNYENVVTIELSRELRKGAHSVAIPSLFPRTHAADKWAAEHQDALKKLLGKE